MSSSDIHNHIILAEDAPTSSRLRDNDIWLHRGSREAFIYQNSDWERLKLALPKDMSYRWDPVGSTGPTGPSESLISTSPWLGPPTISDNNAFALYSDEAGSGEVVTVTLIGLLRRVAPIKLYMYMQAVPLGKFNENYNEIVNMVEHPNLLVFPYKTINECTVVPNIDQNRIEIEGHPPEPGDTHSLSVCATRISFTVPPGVDTDPDTIYVSNHNTARILFPYIVNADGSAPDPDTFRLLSLKLSLVQPH